MGKFNVGDKVRFIENYGDYVIGDVVKVTSLITDKHVLFEGMHGEGDSYTKRIELVEPKRTKNQRITTLEKEVAELKLIVHELRGKQVEPSAINDVEDIIEFEGAKYRKVDRLAQEGDVVVLSERCSDNTIHEYNTPYKVVLDGGKQPCIRNEFEALVYNKGFNRTSETVDVYELIADEKPNQVIGEIKIPVAKTPNQQRKEIIEKAKKFVEVKSECLKDSLFVPGGFERKEKENPNYNSYILEVEFFTNEEKRIVTALCKAPSSGLVRTKGIAKCNPSDVFNEHIGKAIALGRALNIDVSEFEQAVQPTEFVVGQIIRTTHMALDDHEIIRIKGNNAYFMDGLREEFHYINRAKDENFKIINDTNAQYGGVE